MMQRRRTPPMPPSYYEDIVKELEHIAAMVRERPELNNEASARLLDIARQIRQDAGLPSKQAKSQ
jgi:hypothetical protein